MPYFFLPFFFCHAKSNLLFLKRRYRIIFLDHHNRSTFRHPHTFTHNSIFVLRFFGSREIFIDFLFYFIYFFGRFRLSPRRRAQAIIYCYFNQFGKRNLRLIFIRPWADGGGGPGRCAYISSHKCHTGQAYNITLHIILAHIFLAKAISAWRRKPLLPLPPLSPSLWAKDSKLLAARQPRLGIGMRTENEC